MRLRLDQRVDLRQGAARVGEAIGRDGARVARGERCIAGRITARDRLGPFEKAVELGPHQVVPQLQRRRILRVPIRACLRHPLQRRHALARHRMRLQVGIHVARLIEDLVGEPLEGLVHALGRLAGRGQKLDAGAVGLVLLGAHVGEQRVLDRGGRPGDRGGASLAHARAAAAAGGDHRADAQDHGDDRLRGRGRHRLAQSRQMAAGDVAGLVREHADDLIWRFRFHQRAAIDEDAAAVGDESVERAIVDDDDLDVLLGEAGAAQDRLGIFPQQLLDLGVADDRRALLRLRGNAGANERSRRHHGDKARRWRRPPRPDRCLSSDHVRLASHHFAAQPSGAPEDGQRGTMTSDCGDSRDQIVRRNAATAGRGLRVTSRA